MYMDLPLLAKENTRTSKQTFMAKAEVNPIKIKICLTTRVDFYHLQSTRLKHDSDKDWSNIPFCFLHGTPMVLHVHRAMADKESVQTADYF